MSVRRGAYQIRANPITPCALDHGVIEAAGVGQTLALYRAMLGMKSAWLGEFRSSQAGFVSMRVGDSLIDLFPSDHSGPDPHHVCIEFGHSIEVLVTALVDQCIPFDPPRWRFSARDIGQIVSVQDPDRHIVEQRTYQKLES